jgi:peptide/nickel transport system permease protein
MTTDLEQRSSLTQEAIDSIDRRRRWQLIKDLFQSRLALFGLLVIIGVVAMGVFAPYLSEQDPKKTNLRVRLLPPVPLEGSSIDYPLGTDAVGRDLWSRLAYGARISLTVGFTSVVIAGALGVFLGLISGYYGGLLDDIIMRLADVQLAFPFILLMLAVLAVVGPGLRNLILVLGLTGWVSYARVVRGQVISLREKEFVEASRAIGATDFRILWLAIFPNVFPPVMVIASFAVASTIIAEASLSFLGLGVSPTTPTWGIMLSEGREYITEAWWLTTIPGAAIALTVFGINVVGDWLRDHFDPRMIE